MASWVRTTVRMCGHIYIHKCTYIYILHTFLVHKFFYKCTYVRLFMYVQLSFCYFVYFHYVSSDKLLERSSADTKRNKPLLQDSG